MPLTDLQLVDLSRHALVEASAGTGKTFTIEHLVVRLLMQDPDLRLENILLVTFTEKATGELKQRIRRQIERALDNDGTPAAMHQKLRATLDGFDHAAITTIHGFCHTLLKEFPFETGSLFQQEVIEDGPLMEQLLRGQMRRQWPARFGQHLETLLALSGFSDDPDGFIRRAVDLACRPWGDPAGEVVIPDPTRMNVERLWQRTRETLLRLEQQVGPPPRFSTAYARLNINSRTREAVIREMVAPIERTLAAVAAEFERLPEWMPLVKTFGRRHASGQTNLERLVPTQWLKQGENLQACPHLAEIQQELQVLVGLLVDFSHLLTLTSVARLRQEARAAKDRNGWISYQDMLARVADFLAGEGAEAGIRHIRDRYRVAFVDEFQDTDALQWRIFSTLFLQDRREASNNRLFLIGDPKQAIYGFRGADIFTYLGARQRMTALAAAGHAQRLELTINWRSLPELVTGFNRIFSQPAWFGRPEEKGPLEIGYPPAASPRADQLPVRVSRDDSQRPAFNVVDLRAANNHAAAKTLLAGFICEEIRYLVEGGGVRIDAGDGCDRALRYGDMAILVRSRAEFGRLEPLLKAFSIPYAYYRQPGLFQSREAHWLNLVLRAVCQPERAPTVRLAFLTPFFDIPPAALAFLNEPPGDHPTRRLLAGWHAQARNGHWGPLFQSLLEDSGLIGRHCTDPGWERTLTNFQQLVDYLEQAAHSNHLDMGGLAALLESLRRADRPAESEADIHQIAEEGQNVRILTMHVSKGLEFPVVFIAGGLTVHPEGGVQVYHIPDDDQIEAGCRKVIDLTGTSGREQAEKEREAENKRLYYVALTRARIKLYVPYYPDSRNYPWLGPVCRFVSQSIEQAFPDNLPDGVRAGWHPVSLTAAAPPPRTTAAAPPGATTLALPAGGLLPLATDFRLLKVTLESFSSIGRRIDQAHSAAGRSEHFYLSEPDRWEADEPAEPPPQAPDAPATDGLPGGSSVGSMFHQIFETIDFQAVMDGPQDILASDLLRQVVAAAVDRYRIDPQWAPQIARIVAATLRSAIQANGATLVLGRLTPGQRRHEMEFYFPLATPWSQGLGVPDHRRNPTRPMEMVMRGFIDLLFEWRGRYYIADWKSNRLAEGYHRAAMAKEVVSAGYDRQCRIYSIAALRWLQARLGARFDPRHHFGGALYLFIRGMGGAGQAGIYHLPPEDLLPLETLEQTINQEIAALPW